MTQPTTPAVIVTVITTRFCFILLREKENSLCVPQSQQHTVPTQDAETSRPVSEQQQEVLNSNRKPPRCLHGDNLPLYWEQKIKFKFCPM